MTGIPTSAGLEAGSVETERDIYEVANQLFGYTDETTPKYLAQFLEREGREAAKLADEIVRLRALIPPSRAAARCCSAVSPCSWQRHHGMESVCPTCTAAAGPTPVPQAVAPTGEIGGLIEGLAELSGKFALANDEGHMFLIKDAVDALTDLSARLAEMKRLRADYRALQIASQKRDTASEAEATALRRKLEEARKALEPFGKFAVSETWLDQETIPARIAVGDIRRAHALREALPAPEGKP